MSNARDIIIRPLVTEKTLSNQDTNNTVVFEVVNQKPKTKRMGRYVGKTNHLKKAYVKLKDGYNIDILADK